MNNKEALTDVLAQMFNKDNLKTDSYLQSHLTPDLKIPLEAIFNVYILSLKNMTLLFSY